MSYNLRNLALCSLMPAMTASGCTAWVSRVSNTVPLIRGTVQRRWF